MSWENFYTEILEEIDRLYFDEDNGCKSPLFRGLSNNSYDILPTLFRDNDNLSDQDFLKKLETNLFVEFESQSTTFYPNRIRSSWEILYEMRHHGIPTRLIDWTESFAIALFFALRNYKPDKSPCVWILNPIELNVKSVNQKKIISVDTSQESDYKKHFITDDTLPFENPIAIYPFKSNPRLIAQNGYFTIHGANVKSLNKIYTTDVIKRFDIPADAISDAKKFLKLTNMNEFSLFPDLDGLCRKLNEKYFPTR